MFSEVAEKKFLELDRWHLIQYALIKLGKRDLFMKVFDSFEELKAIFPEDERDSEVY